MPRTQKRPFSASQESFEAWIRPLDAASVIECVCSSTRAIDGFTQLIGERLIVLRVLSLVLIWNSNFGLETGYRQTDISVPLLVSIPNFDHLASMVNHLLM